MYAQTNTFGLADDGLIPMVGTPPGGWEAQNQRVLALQQNQANPYQGTPAGITTPTNNDLVINKLLFDIKTGFTADNKFQEKEWSDFLEKHDIEQKFSAYGYSVSYKTLTWVSLAVIALLTYLWLT